MVPPHRKRFDQLVGWVQWDPLPPPPARCQNGVCDGIQGKSAVGRPHRPKRSLRIGRLEAYQWGRSQLVQMILCEIKNRQRQRTLAIRG